MSALTVGLLLAALILLIFLSAFFSSSETGMMSVNRYRISHLAKNPNNKSARRVQKLLERPDRLLGVILIGNTFANILASSIATVLATHFIGDVGVVIATIILTLVVLIFAEVAPKTLAVLYPEKLSFRFSFPLVLLLRLFYPLVWLINGVANGMLKLFEIKVSGKRTDHFSRDEFRTMIFEAGGKIPPKHQTMLLSILELQDISIENIMVPRQEIIGVDIEDDMPKIINQLNSIQHTRLPLYRYNIDDVIGMIHARTLLKLFSQENLTKESIVAHAQPLLFTPEGTTLNKQLINFQREKCRSAFVVDEYGDIQGLITLEDILEEIVGEFTTDFATHSQEISEQADGSFLIDGTCQLRKLNRVNQWHFETDGPKTLSGLIIEQLQAIPRPGTGLRINGYPVEVLKVQDNRVKTARVQPKLRINPAKSVSSF